MFFFFFFGVHCPFLRTREGRNPGGKTALVSADIFTYGGIPLSGDTSCVIARSGQLVPGNGAPDETGWPPHKNAAYSVHAMAGRCHRAPESAADVGQPLAHRALPLVQDPTDDVAQ